MKDTNAKIVKRDDALWKAILEDLFDDFLMFFFPKDYHLFDMERGFVFLDKELHKLFPQDKDLYHPKYVDKLVKVFMKNGTELWFLIHIEVQGYEDKNFENRMFTYYYRLVDRYQKDITALAIFADDKAKYSPKSYEKSFLGTTLSYHFNTYKIINQSDEDLALSNNPFAIVIQTVKVALKEKKLKPEGLLGLKVELVKNLLKKDISKIKIEALMNFIRKYVRLENGKLDIKFDEIIDEITDKPVETMGIKEFILEREKFVARQEGRQEGKEEGRQEGKEEGKQEGYYEKDFMFVKSLLINTDFDDTKIATLANVTLDFVKKVRDELFSKI